MKQILYLASPYSHPVKATRLWRFNTACKCAATLMQQGHVVFSPIAHSHPISEQMEPKFATDFDFWMDQDLPILQRCDKLVVLTLNGWEKSRGVNKEIKIAKIVASIPIVYITEDPKTWNIQGDVDASRTKSANPYAVSYSYIQYPK